MNIGSRTMTNIWLEMAPRNTGKLETESTLVVYLYMSKLHPIGPAIAIGFIDCDTSYPLTPPRPSLKNVVHPS